MSAKKEVCIIGAGPAGILAISTLKDCANVTCFERANDIGGQWALGTDEFTQKHYGSRQSRFIFMLRFLKSFHLDSPFSSFWSD